MNRWVLEISGSAQQDLKDLFGYIKERNPIAADAVLDRILHAVDLLADHNDKYVVAYKVTQDRSGGGQGDACRTCWAQQPLTPPLTL